MTEPVGVVRRATAPFTAASARIQAAVQGIADFVKLEVVVTAVCVFIPFMVAYGDGWVLRDSISAYYSMTEGQYFYVPLTAAAMLFVVNGVVKRRHWYNVALGLALLTLTVLDQDDHNLVHNVAATVFFAGNAAVFVIFTPKKELWFKVLLALGVAVAMLGHFWLDLYSLFWAESLSLWVIAFHYVLEAMGLVE